MSKLSNIFSKAPVRIQNRSGYDLSHYNVGSMLVGKLVPVLCEPLCPNDKVSLGALANVELPPMASNFIGRVDLKLEAFFCPNRLAWRGWQQFFNYFNQDTPVSRVQQLPALNIYEAISLDTVLGPTTLMDYIGVKSRGAGYHGSGTFELGNPLPLIHYHLIYDRWYRDKVLQRPLFLSEEELNDVHPLAEPEESKGLRSGVDFEEGRGKAQSMDNTHDWFFDPVYQFSILPYSYGMNGINSDKTFIYQFEYYNYDESIQGTNIMLSASDMKLADGSKVFALHNRNYAKDYFTAATPKPQAGDPISVSTSGNSFSIAALRAADALQRFAEKYNVAGSDYADQIRAVYGITPADAVVQHPVYLGSATINVYNRSVVQTSQPSSQVSTRNPFTTIGTTFGKSAANGSSSLIGNFTASEHGYLFVIASLVPHSFYGSGIRRHLFYNTLSDFPIPDLAGVGDQEIYMTEVADKANASSLANLKNIATPFGYTQRYAEAKFVPDQVHGILRDGSSLQHFAIQRTFNLANGDVQVGSDFIEVKHTAMDNVSAVASSISSYGAWYQIYFDFKKSSILPAYSIPTLGINPDSHVEMVDRGGKRL